MPASFILLKCVCKAVLRHGLNALAGGLPLGDVLLDVADGVMDDWKKQQPEAERRAELQALAQAGPQEVRQQVSQVVAEVADQQPAEVRQALTDYLLQMPATLRQSLRRLADPTGTTVPTGLQLRKAEDLLPFLPANLPHFKQGERPPGIGDWELLELLGIGGFGEVWKAQNPHLPGERPVALKFCLDPATAAALRNEAALLARVQREGKHPGIVELRHTYLSAEPPCLEYEYVEGGDLAGVIQESHRSAQGGLAPAEAARLILRLAGTVGHIHQLRPPLVHRDLKPANILVQPGKHGDPQLKIADFGIGGVVAQQALKQATRMGSLSRSMIVTTGARGSYTPLYASPQQMRGDPPDPSDDVYALGVIWYQLLSGDLMSGAPGGLRWLNELRRRGMEEPLLQLLASCYEAHSDDRPANAAVLAENLRALLPPEALPSQPPMFSPQAGIAPSPQVSSPQESRVAIPAEEHQRPAEAQPRPTVSAPDSEELERAEDAVYGPAIGYLILGIVLVCAGLVGLYFGTLGNPGYYYHETDGVYALFPIALLFAVLFLTAGLQLIKLEAYSLAMIASIVAMAAGVTGVGLPIAYLGLWAHMVLRRPKVKAAFLHRWNEKNPRLPETREGALMRRRAKFAIVLPAVSQLCIGLFGIALAIILIVSAADTTFGAYLGRFIVHLLLYGWSLVLIVGAIKMLRLESYQFARLSSILAIVPGLLVFLVPALIGAWSLTVLNNPLVRSAFQASENVDGHSVQRRWP
jgi:serine/threonine protein kinase